MTPRDTIAAVSTPPGRGAVAMIRVSGPEALRLVRRIAPRLDADPSPRRAELVRLGDPETGRGIDRALVTFFPGPESYTGEDLVEVSTHGGRLVPSLVLRALEALGARQARPGEFTERAYLNGKVDLVQAEGVRDVIEAGSAEFHAAALHQMEGGLSRRLAALRQDLVRLEALLAHHIDFPDEDEPPTPVGRIAEEGRRVATRLDALLESAPRGQLLRDGALVVLAGRPNAGKSSLFNALLGMERAIVSEEPGTTRDAVEAPVSIQGYPFRLVDTAGIREAEGEVERIGVEVARGYLKGADIVVLCVSAEWGWGSPEEGFLATAAGVPTVVVETKIDRWPESAEAPGRGADGLEVVRVSAKEGDGVAGLGSLLVEAAFERGVSSSSDVAVFLTRERQVRGVRDAHEEVTAFVEALEAGLPAEVASTHLRPAESALEELLGIISPEDVLDRVFSEFCIGK